MGNNLFLSDSKVLCNVFLDMNNNIITNLPTPVNPSEGINKGYIDSIIATHLTASFIPLAAIPGTTVSNVQEALVDIYSKAKNGLLLSGGTMTGDIDMNNNSVINLATPSESDTQNAVNVQYVNTYLQNNLPALVNPFIEQIKKDLKTIHNTLTTLSTTTFDLYLPITGGAMKGDIQMNNHALTGVTTPVDTETDYIANVDYVNTYLTNATVSLSTEIDKNTTDLSTFSTNITAVSDSVNSRLPLSGGSMTGSIAMNNNSITGVIMPKASSSSDAANVGYVNNILGTLRASPYYMAQQLSAPTFTTTNCAWIDPTNISSNKFFSGPGSESFYSFDSTYTQFYIMQQGLYLLNFNVLKPVSGSQGELSFYLNQGSNSYQIGSCFYSSVGGWASMMVVVGGTPSDNQCYLSFNNTIGNVSAATTMSILWLPIYL